MLALECANGQSLLWVDHGNRSSAVFQANLDWDTNCGPDILSEPSAFEQNLVEHVEKQSDYLRQVTLFEAMLNERLFNGFGPLLANEILQRLYYYFGKS